MHDDDDDEVARVTAFFSLGQALGHFINDTDTCRDRVTNRNRKRGKAIDRSIVIQTVTIVAFALTTGQVGGSHEAEVGYGVKISDRFRGFVSRLSRIDRDRGFVVEPFRFARSFVLVRRRYY